MNHKYTLVWIALLGLALMGCTGKPDVAHVVTPGPAAVEAQAKKAGAPEAMEPGAGAAVPGKAVPAPSKSSDLAWANDFGIVAGDYTCDEKRIVSQRPDKADSAWVIWEIYDAARLARLGGDDEALFQRFAGVFANKHKREWVREQYWSRAKMHVNKYTRSSADSAFVVCKTQTSGNEQKFFIRSFDSQKSNPPITVAREGGGFKVFFFSY